MMWRQNAHFAFYSDSESSDTDSGVTPSDSDSSTSSDTERNRGARGARNGGGQGDCGDKAAGKSPSSSTVSSSSSGCVSNSSSRSVGGTAGVNKTNKPGPLLSRRGSGGGSGGDSGQGSRQLSQKAAGKVDTSGGRKGASPLLFRNPDPRRPVWATKDGPKPPPVPPNQRKPPAGRAVHQSRKGSLTQRPPPPGTHAVKPRSNSVNKAVPEKRHSKASDNLKSLYPRIKSAQPARLAYQHRPQRAPYDARMLALNIPISDSSSSDDHLDEDDDDSDDDSSDDL